MVIRTALEDLKKSDHPLARIIHHDKGCKTVALVFKKGMTLKEHKTNEPSTLLVLDGEIHYRAGDEEIILRKYNQTGIAPGVLHEVTASEDSVCLLIQG